MSLSLLTILLLSTIPFNGSFGVKSAGAENISIQWGHLVVDDYGGYNETERYYYADDVCEYIYGLYENHPWLYDDYNTWNAYWDYTTSDFVGTCLDMQNDYGSVYFVTNWWVGDFHPDSTPSPGPCGHFWLYGDDGDDISDDFVRTHATDDGLTTSKQKFNFIWACANADLCCYDAYGNYYNVAGIFTPLENPCTPPPTNNNTKYGFYFGTPPYPLDTYGMPFAWTGRLDMNLDGYNSNSGGYCYIGFEGASPFMGDYLPGTNVAAVNFPCCFYLRFLGWDMPYYLPQQVDDSLDYASGNTYWCDFDESDLYTGYWMHTDVNEGDPVTGWWFCHMRVFGNGDLTLAY
jgi:hypothetical protein